MNRAFYNAPEDVVPVGNAKLGGLSSTMMYGADSPHMIPKYPLLDTQQKIGEYGSNLNQNVTQPHRFSDINQWVNTEPTTSASFENVLSPSYINLPAHTAVVSIVPPEGHPTRTSHRGFLQLQHRPRSL